MLKDNSELDLLLNIDPTPAPPLRWEGSAWRKESY